MIARGEGGLAHQKTDRLFLQTKLDTTEFDSGQYTDPEQFTYSEGRSESEQHTDSDQYTNSELNTKNYQLTGEKLFTKPIKTIIKLRIRKS